MLIDTHCHLHNLDTFEGRDFSSLKQKALEHDVTRAVVIGTSFEDSKIAESFARESSAADLQIFWTYGVHPSEFEKPRPEPSFSQTSPKMSPQSSASGASPQPPTGPVAIGEVGLDYHYGPEFYETPGQKPLSERQIKQGQARLLEEMLDLALKNDLPLSFHVREAFDDFFAILSNFSQVRGVIHSFSDNKKNLKKCLDYGFYIGVNGMATYSTLPLPPLDRTLSETDAPYLAPVPHRHELNEPAYISHVVGWLAVQHRISPAEVATAIAKNTKDLFGI